MGKSLAKRLPKAEMIAPCGMDCALCAAHQRAKKPCASCLGEGNKPAHCRTCTIKNCAAPERGTSGFCYDCEKFPCGRLKELDARYRKNYGMSMVENQEYIGRNGMDAFLEWEAERWACPACGKLLCVHRDACQYCGGKKG